MRETVGSDMGVKASGGVRDFEKAQAMIELVQQELVQAAQQES